MFLHHIASNITISTENDVDVKQTNDVRPRRPSLPITIIAQPREKFRPRTEKESQESSHYIRTEDNIQLKYPTIEVGFFHFPQTTFDWFLSRFNQDGEKKKV